MWKARITVLPGTDFGDTDDPSSVTEWRELFPDEYACPNGDGRCNHLGRKESVFIPTGSYFHLWMGMKFPDFERLDRIRDR